MGGGGRNAEVSRFFISFVESLSGSASPLISPSSLNLITRLSRVSFSLPSLSLSERHSLHKIFFTCYFCIRMVALPPSSAKRATTSVAQQNKKKFTFSMDMRECSAGTCHPFIVGCFFIVSYSFLQRSRNSWFFSSCFVSSLAPCFEDTTYSMTRPFIL